MLHAIPVPSGKRRHGREEPKTDLHGACNETVLSTSSLTGAPGRSRSLHTLVAGGDGDAVTGPTPSRHVDGKRLP